MSLYSSMAFILFIEFKLPFLDATPFTNVAQVRNIIQSSLDDTPMRLVGVATQPTIHTGTCCVTYLLTHLPTNSLT